MATEAASAGAGAAYEELRRKRILENLKHLESTRASPKSGKKFEVTTQVRRSSRARNTPVSYKEDISDDDNYVHRRRVSRGPENERGYTGRISSYKQQERAFNRAEKFQDSLDPGSLSFVKPMVRSHVSGCFWLGLPSKFCEDHLPPSEYKMVLEDEEGGEFDVAYIGSRTGLSGGWRGLVMHHDLADGDSLVFELSEPDRFKIYIFKAIEDVNEAKPGDKTADMDTTDSDSAQEEPDQTDSPVSEPPSSPEPLKGIKRSKTGGRQ